MRFVIGVVLIVAGSVWAVDRQPCAYAGEDMRVVVGEQLAFGGRGICADDEIVEYSWDFSGDGVADFVSAQSGRTTYRFSFPGRYECMLKVRDALGRTAKDSCLVTVVTEEGDLAIGREEPGPGKSGVVKSADGVRHRYAIMINGSGEERFGRDVELGYDMLVGAYGFSDQDVYVLNYTGPDGGDVIDYKASLANLEAVFDDLALKTDGDDEVFVWITGHGRGYEGPLSQGGQYLGYLDGRASVDSGDEEDFAESDFKLRSLFTGGDYRCNHGMNVWKVRRKYSSPTRTNFYRNMFVSKFRNVIVEDLGGKVTDTDVFIERFVDCAMGDTNKDEYIDTAAGEVFDYDGDGNPPYDPVTGEFDEDDWGEIDKMEDDYNKVNTQVPQGGSPYKIFDEGFAGKICIDLGYAGGEPVVDGRDEDGEGLFDWIDVNQDGDTLDIVSIDEGAVLYAEELYDDDLAVLVGRLSVAKVTIVAEPCFSGGFIEDLSAPNRVICTAAIEDAVSWGNLFIRSFTAALAKVDETGLQVDADTNGNGAVSMLEAFNHAAGNDYYDEIPQYDDNGDGTGQVYPAPTGGDGATGCQTYLEDITAGDVNGDNHVDFADFAVLAGHWLESDCGSCGPIDLNCDGMLDLWDLDSLSDIWGGG